MRCSRLLTLFLLLVVLIYCGNVFAQSDNGAITGTVTDSTGAVVPNAKITATNQATGETRKTESTADGNYLLPELKAQPWKLTIEAQGFKTSTTQTIQVAVQVTRTVNVKLEVGAVTQEVTVQGTAPTIQTETSVAQSNVTERQVREMPLQVAAESLGRTPLSFIFLDSTVTATTQRGTDATNFRVNGSQALGAEILIDGASTRRAQNGTYFSEVAPGPNAFQEFTISTSNYSAEFGGSSGGVVNFTFKSGTNKLHGEAYELFHNEALNANSWTNNNAQPAPIPRNRDRQHDFGFNIGGPVVIPKLYDGRNKTFFFGNFEGYRFSMSETVDVTVPTVKMKTGDFSELLDPTLMAPFGGPQQIYDPHQSPYTRTAIPGNRLDQYNGGALLDPAGMAIMSYWPDPTSSGIYHNYRASSTVPLNMNSFILKGDQIISDKQRLGMSYSYRKATTLKSWEGLGFPRFPEPAVRYSVWDQTFASHYARLQHDYTITPNILNHLNLGWNRVFVANLNMGTGFNPSTLGIPANATQGAAFPAIETPGYGDPIGSTDAREVQPIGSTWFSDTQGDNTVEISDTVSMVHGKHTLKFGFDHRIQQLNITQFIDPGGHFNFRAEQTQGLIPNGDGTYRRDGGWPLASLATGATEWSFITITTTAPAWRYHTPAFFVNDDFRVTPRLTLNFGMRYDIPYPRHEANNHFRGFDPTAMNPVAQRLGAIAGAGGQGGVLAKEQSLIPADYSNIAPRLGFAYSVNSKTAVRGGIGAYYSPLLYGYGGGNDPASGILGYRTNRISRPDYDNPAYAPFGDMVSTQFLSTYIAAPTPDPGGQFLGSDVEYFVPSSASGRSVQWSLDVQRELPKSFTLSLGYVGHKDTRLRSGFKRVNALPLDDLKLGFPLLIKNINTLTAGDRAYATSVGITLPPNGDAVYPGFNGNVAQALMPFPQYGRINSLLESNGQAWYNGMTVKLDRRFSNGLQFNVGYTWSKLITTAADDLFGGSALTGILQNPYNINDPSGVRSISPTNASHVVSISYLYELPFGKGKMFANQGGVLDKVVGGWQFSGIHRYQSGLPLVAHIDDNGLRGWLDTVGYWGNLRPNLTGAPILTSNSLSGANVTIVNSAAFAPPPNYEAAPTGSAIGDAAYTAYYAKPTNFFGNAPAVLPATRSLPFYSENFNILKKTSITESMTMEIGAEFFNIFNRHRYWAPDMNLGGWDATNSRWTNGNFGNSSVINDTTTYAPRTIQLRARFIF